MPSSLRVLVLAAPVPLAKARLREPLRESLLLQARRRASAWVRERALVRQRAVKLLRVPRQVQALVRQRAHRQVPVQLGAALALPVLSDSSLEQRAARSTR
ncbi:MAG TPA: hypothetical protein VER11_11835 [Polyangiaceae bacterium]|nr:hypothetical protein [Polyangiaceae bacterium]